MKTLVQKEIGRSRSDQVRSKRRGASIRLEAEARLNEAYDRLNAVEIQCRSLPLELSDIVSEALQKTMQLYFSAHKSYLQGRLQKSLELSQLILQMTSLMEFLSLEEIQNVLSLPLPPRLKKHAIKHSRGEKKGESTFKQLDSVLKKKIETGSRFYPLQILDYPQVFKKVARELKNSKVVH